MATLVTQDRNRSATTHHLLVEEGVSCHISQRGPKHQDCTVEIIQIRHACNYRYFIQTGGAATSLGIWGIISLDAKQENDVVDGGQADVDPAQGCLVGQRDNKCPEDMPPVWASQPSSSSAVPSMRYHTGTATQTVDIHLQAS